MREKGRKTDTFRESRDSPNKKRSNTKINDNKPIHKTEFYASALMYFLEL